MIDKLKRVVGRGFAPRTRFVFFTREKDNALAGGKPPIYN